MKNLIADIDKLQKEILAIKPLSTEQLNELKKYYKIGLTFSSNALEGNSLTESETKIAIEDGLTVAGKPIKDYNEAIGHSLAYDKIFQLIDSNAITEKDIKELHRLFYKNIDEKNAGKYRKIKVFISGSNYFLPSPSEVPTLMQKLEIKINNYLETEHPVIASAKIHKEFVMIHPFIDGNGRVARLLMNLFLLKNKFPITLIPAVLRLEYITALEKAHTDETKFIEFIAERVRQAQIEYIRLLK